MWFSYAGVMVGLMVTFSGSPQELPLRLVPQQAEKALPELERGKAPFQRLETVAETLPRHDAAAFDPARPIPEPAERAKNVAVSPLVEMNQLLTDRGSSRGMDLMADVTLSRWKDVYSSHTLFQDPPELSKVVGFNLREIDPSRMAGYNLGVLTRYGVHPFVSPGLNSRAQASEVPLGVDGASYELTQRFLHNGELPRRDALRTEDFLAAIDYRFAPPTHGPLALSVAGGISAFRSDGRRLLQIGVQARGIQDSPHPPTRVTLVIDTSSSMGQNGRLDIVCEAIDRWVSQLKPEDCLSVITFDEEAHLLAEDMTAADARSVSWGLSSLHPRGATNLGAALALAYAVAKRSPKPGAGTNRVVLLTDGEMELDPAFVQTLESRLDEARGMGVYLDLVAIRQETASAQSTMSLLAQAGGGAGETVVHRAQNADQIRWTLAKILSKKSQLVASGVHLKVSFNPRAVVGYRLIGHEAGGILLANPAPLQTDFFSGQSGSALYEVVLSPQPEGEVATAEVSWHDSRGGLTSTSVGVYPDQLRLPAAQASASLQAAAVAAEAAEILRGVPEIGPAHPWVKARAGSGSLSQVIRVGQQFQARALKDSESFARFLTLLEQAESLRGAKNGAKK